jgi:hypothetical protein
MIFWYFSRGDSVESQEEMRHSTMALFKESLEGSKRLKHVKFEIFGDEVAVGYERVSKPS